MEPNGVLEKRISRIRLMVWTATGLMTFLWFRSIWPLAWQVSAFSALFTLFWPLLGGKGEGEKRRREEETTQSTILDPQSTIEIGLDLLAATLLIGVSGGFGSPFASLILIVALEAFLLQGLRAAMQTACVAAVLNLVHFHSGMTPSAAILYGLAMGTLCAALFGVKMAQAQEAEVSGQSHNTGLMRAVDMADLQAQLEAAQQAQEDIKDKYRSVINLNRDQKMQMARLRTVEQLCELGGEPLGEDSSGRMALRRVLRLVMELTGAEGGVLWLREPGTNVFTIRTAEGKVAAHIQQDTFSQADVRTPDAIRAYCETALLNASPAALPPRSRLDALSGVKNESGLPRDEEDFSPYAIVATQAVRAPETSGFAFLNPEEKAPDEENEFALLLDAAAQSQSSASRKELAAANPGLVGVTLLRTRPTTAEPLGQVMGAIGICDPRGRQRFLSSELEKVSSLCRVLTSTISSICERADAQRQVQEQTLLRELHRMAQSAGRQENRVRGVYRRNEDRRWVAARIVEMVVELTPCENCTLFLLDARGQRLEAEATHGQVINLLDNIRFDRGYGVSGWVASRGRMLNIPDLTQEPNLRDIETIPAQARSFLALPLRVGDDIMGVLNVSHSRPHAFTTGHVRLLSELTEPAALLLATEKRDMFAAV